MKKFYKDFKNYLKSLARDRDDSYEEFCKVIDKKDIVCLEENKVYLPEDLLSFKTGYIDNESIFKTQCIEYPSLITYGKTAKKSIKEMEDLLKWLQLSLKKSK